MKTNDIHYTDSEAYTSLNRRIGRMLEAIGRNAWLILLYCAGLLTVYLQLRSQM